MNKIYPNNSKKIRDLSIIEEGPPKKVRMTSLCLVVCHKVNGVSKTHTNLIRNNLFKDYFEVFP